MEGVEYIVKVQQTRLLVYQMWNIRREKSSLAHKKSITTYP